MKKILLVTSPKVGFTGTVSFSYLFETGEGPNKDLSLYEKHREICSEPFGYIHSNEDGVMRYNLFTGGTGLLVSGAFNQNHDDWCIEALPEACSMLCTKADADKLVLLLEPFKDQIEVFVEFFEKTLLISY